MSSRIQPAASIFIQNLIGAAGWLIAVGGPLVFLGLMHFLGNGQQTIDIPGWVDREVMVFGTWMLLQQLASMLATGLGLVGLQQIGLAVIDLQAARPAVPRQQTGVRRVQPSLRSPGADE